MIKLKSLIEIIVPDKSEFESFLKKPKSEGILFIYLNKNGRIRIEDPENIIPPEVGETNLMLDFGNKEVIISPHHIHGNKISTKSQKMISSLVKSNVIDSSWKVSFRDHILYTKGWDQHVKRQAEFDNIPPTYWNRKTTIGNPGGLILYHGTSEKELPSIQKRGLHPLGRVGSSGSHETRLRIPENERFIYLSGTFIGAFRYAKSKAQYNMMKYNRDSYESSKTQDWNDWDIKPVILFVKIPDMGKLRSDDDIIISIIKSKATELWNDLSPEEKSNEQEKSVKWFKENGLVYKPHQIDSNLWSVSDNGFNIVISKIDKKEWKNWKRSLDTTNQVGYEGSIPPNYIQVLDLDKVIPTKK